MQNEKCSCAEKKQKPSVCFWKKAVWTANSFVDFIVMIICILLLLFGCYAMWDTNQIYHMASSNQYETYKPVTDNTLSFEELQEINSDVVAWLNIYGTNIDYPVVQGKKNDDYINTNIMGEYSLAGSIFLDYRNSKKFTDFNNIIYGHHMENSAMFGEIENFGQEGYFKDHQYGQLFCNGNNYGLEFFAFLNIDAYDSYIYSPAIQDAEKQKYLDELFKKVKHTRDIKVNIEDRIVLLSTCSASSTNGRHVLVGKIINNIPLNNFENKEDGLLKNKSNEYIKTIENIFKRMPLWVWLILWIILLLIILLFCENKKKKRISERKNVNEQI
jgi:sortase, SrtB family